MSKMTSFKDQMCACKDSACAQRVSDAQTQWGRENVKEMAQPSTMTQEDARKFTKLGEEMGACMQKAFATAYPPQSKQGG